MDSINPLSPSSLIDSATSQGRGWNSQNQQLPTLGQLFKALVIEAQEDGRFILDIGGNRLTASSTTTLSQGQALQLQVVKTEPLIELKIVRDNTSSPFAGRSLTLLGKSIDVSSLLQTLRQLDQSVPGSLNPFSRGVLESFFTLQQNILDNKDGGSALKQLIGNLGLNLERLLAKGDRNEASQTLKAALLELVHKFGSTEIGEKAGKFVSTLELFQLTQLQAGTDTQYIFPLPLPFAEQGYLLIERDGQGSETGKKDRSERRFSLHLTMSDLGNLRIDFFQNAEGLLIKFAADSKEKADFLAAFGDELRDSITAAPLIGLTFSGGASDPINDLIRRLVPEGRSMLDMKV